MKKYWTAFLSGLAVTLGVVVWAGWLLLKHKQNLKDSQEFLSINTERKNIIMHDMQLKETEFENRAAEITKLYERQTKQEVINAFKEAFSIPSSNN